MIKKLAEIQFQRAFFICKNIFVFNLHKQALRGFLSNYQTTAFKHLNLLKSSKKQKKDKHFPAKICFIVKIAGNSFCRAEPVIYP